MADPADVQAHWTRAGVLARINAALTKLGHDPQNLNPEILATLEHLHSGGFATTRDQVKRIALTDESRVLDVGCGIGGPARYLAHMYGCRVDGIDLAPELIETGRVLTERCKSTLSQPDLRRGLVPKRHHEYRGQVWLPRGRLPSA